jgi:anti-sigma regulatory factor (Ser/Thr protein kinase)
LPKRKSEYKLRIPSQTDNLELIRDFVSKLASKVGFSEEDVGKIELAVDEACTNVIKHAYKKDVSKPIDIVIKIGYAVGKLTLLDIFRLPLFHHQRSRKEWENQVNQILGRSLVSCW